MASYFNFRCHFYNDCHCKTHHTCETGETTKCISDRMLPGELRVALRKPPATINLLMTQEALQTQDLLDVVQRTRVSKLCLDFKGQATMLQREHLPRITHLTMTSIVSVDEWVEMQNMKEMRKNQISMQNTLISARNLEFLHISNMNIQRITWREICLAMRNPKLKTLHLGMLLFDDIGFDQELKEAENFHIGLLYSNIKCLNLCWKGECPIMTEIIYRLISASKYRLPNTLDCLSVQTTHYNDSLAEPRQKLPLREFTLYYFNYDDLQKGKDMVCFLSHIEANEIKVVEKLADQFLSRDIYKITDEKEYELLGNAYKEVILFARDVLGHQFCKITFFNHELKVIKIGENTPRKYSHQIAEELRDPTPMYSKKKPRKVYYSVYDSYDYSSESDSRMESESVSDSEMDSESETGSDSDEVSDSGNVSDTVPTVYDSGSESDSETIRGSGSESDD